MSFCYRLHPLFPPLIFKGAVTVKQKLKPIAVSLCLLGIISMPAFADTAVSSQNTDSSENIASRTQDLEQQLNKIQKEMRSLKAQMKAQHKKVTSPSPMPQQVS